MQIVFKTSYDQDINLLSKRGEYIRVTTVILLLLAAPLFLDVYYLSELGLLLVYVIAGVGLMILTGFTGQVSFGHAAFLGLGAYCHSILMTHGLPFSISLVLTTIFTGIVGMLLGRSASKMHGFYLAVATLAFLISRVLLRDWVQARFAKQLKAVNDQRRNESLLPSSVRPNTGPSPVPMPRAE